MSAVDSDPAVLAAIPHRPPFLFIDRVVESTNRELRAQKFIAPDLDVFRGHYPGYPVLPGALILEAIFQAGALLLARQVEPGATGLPVVTRVRDAQFKRMVRPGELLELHVCLDDRQGPAFYMVGRAEVAGEKAARCDFTCTLVPRP